MITWRTFLGMVVAAVLLPTDLASAQDALGDGTQLGTGTGFNANLTTRRNPDGSFSKSGFGNSLDANTMVGGGGWNRAGGGGDDFGWRNAIVTGNVAGGRGFRGSVGYTAANEFRGETGSNDLFRFRADSAYSSPLFARMGLSFEQFRFGQDMAILEIPRAQTGASPDRLAPPVFQPSFVLAAQARIDRENMMTSSAINLESIAEPRIVGSAWDAQGRPLVLNASPTRGLTAEPPQFTPNLAGLTLWDSARVREDVAAGRPNPSVGMPFETSMISAAEASSRLSSEQIAQPETPQSVSRYDNLLEQVARRFATLENVDYSAQPEEKQKLEDAYQELRRRLTGETTPSKDEKDKDKDKDQQQQPQPPQETEQPGLERPGEGEAPPEEGDGITPQRKDPDKPPPPVFSPDEFTEALRHGEHIDKLSPEDQSRIDELMSRAEQRLKEGQYFLAERLFERALRFTPGQPLATVGLAHSQTGSGLYLSAAATLRNLLARQPELIDVMYGPNVLPSKERLRDNVATIQERLTGTKNLDSYGFMLAYLGHQLGDRALMSQGLDAMSAAAPDDPLAPLLRAIWLAPPGAESSNKAPSAPAEPGK